MGIRNLIAYASLALACGCSNPRKAVLLEEKESQPRESVTQEHYAQREQCFNYTIAKDDNPWNLSIEFYGSGTENKRIMSDNNIYNPTRLMPGETIAVYLTEEQAARFRKRHPSRGLADCVIYRHIGILF